MLNRHDVHRVDGGSTLDLGRVPQVETSAGQRDSGTRFLTHAHVQLLPAVDKHGNSLPLQSISATVVGFDRVGALADLERTLRALLDAVVLAKEQEPLVKYSRTCACHSCCTLSCCNPHIEPALVLSGGGE
jgi:hypothetical protein